MTSKARPWPREFGPIRLARWSGLTSDQFRRAYNRGLIPAPDIDDRRWSQTVAESLPERAPDIVRVIGDHPGLGSRKAADRLKERTALDVTCEDVVELAAQGRLSPVGEYMGAGAGITRWGTLTVRAGRYSVR